MNNHQLKEKVETSAKRLSRLESRVDTIETKQDEMDKSVLENRIDMKYLTKSHESLNRNIQKVLWLFAASLIAAVVSFIVKGGLT